MIQVDKIIGGTKSPSAKQAIRFAQGGLWDEAIESAKKGIEEFPLDPEAHYILAISYQASARFVEAEETLKKLIGFKSNAKYSKELSDNRRIWNDTRKFNEQMN